MRSFLIGKFELEFIENKFLKTSLYLHEIFIFGNIFIKYAYWNLKFLQLLI
jgi:hypothetical protein